MEETQTDAGCFPTIMYLTHDSQTMEPDSSGSDPFSHLLCDTGPLDFFVLQFPHL